VVVSRVLNPHRITPVTYTMPPTRHDFATLLFSPPLSHLAVISPPTSITLLLWSSSLLPSGRQLYTRFDMVRVPRDPRCRRRWRLISPLFLKLFCVLPLSPVARHPGLPGARDSVIYRISLLVSIYIPVHNIPFIAIVL